MRIFSDPHIGTNRMSHCTKTSRELLTKTIYEAALEATESKSSVVCVGDLFDKFSNKEKYIAMGMSVASRCDLLLAGNHDSSNVKGSVASIDLVKASFNLNLAKFTSLDKPYIHEITLEGIHCVSVPHQATQEVFLKALKLAYNKAKVGSIIFLHCNFDNDLAEGVDTSLNLPRKEAITLLKKFDYIFIGHEHVSREELDGRVIIVGNPFPTSFSDISDKYVWDYDGKSAPVKSQVFWAEEAAKEVTYKAGDLPITANEEVKFLTLKGEITYKDSLGLVKYLKELWKLNPQLLMVRNSVDILRVTTEGANLDSANLNELPNKIAKFLPREELKDLWNTYYEESIK